MRLPLSVYLSLRLRLSAVCLQKLPPSGKTIRVGVISTVPGTTANPTWTLIRVKLEAPGGA